MQYVVNNGISHLLVDFPSVDRMYDDGKMSNHCLFWEVDRESREMGNRQAAERTITEMIFVPDELHDGIGVLDIQVPRWHSDAAPSRPVWYPLVPNQKEQKD